MFKLMVFPIFLAFMVDLNTPMSLKENFCSTFECELKVQNKSVCGIRSENGGFRLKLFENECELVKHGCKVGDNETFGITDIEDCDSSFLSEENLNTNIALNNKSSMELRSQVNGTCNAEKCEMDNNYQICGIRKDGEGFRVRLFQNECDLLNHNCKTEVKFSKTDYLICHSPNSTEENDVDNNEDLLISEKHYPNKAENIIVIDGSDINFTRNINESIENFFAATHFSALTLKELPVAEQVLHDTRRNMLIKSAGPVVVYKPSINVPINNRSNDHWHMPTVNSCSHKCPTKCPDTYDPVCGVPGSLALEPSLSFKNHCFMDMAQCKMYWEDKSITAHSSAYIEAAFIFCIGKELSEVYRFMPFLRTLQHMGRLKKKGKFHYKLRNLRFFNNRLQRDPKIMG